MKLKNKKPIKIVMSKAQSVDTDTTKFNQLQQQVQQLTAQLQAL